MRKDRAIVITVLVLIAVCAVSFACQKAETAPPHVHTFVDGVCTGCGAVENMELTAKEDGTYELSRYTGASSEVIVCAKYGEKVITSIGKGAFAENKIITSVTLGVGITEVGEQAFENCAALVKVKVSYTVTKIRKQAFSGCTNLQSIIYSGSQTKWNAVEKGEGWSEIAGDYTLYLYYEHSPLDNPKAVADIVADETAVYGFRPSETGSLKSYADQDWSDVAFVEKNRQERIDYHNTIKGMYVLLNQMLAEGRSVEEIARALCDKRNQIRLESYEGDPEGLATCKARNLEKYGYEEGPHADDLYVQYGSWEMVITKSFSVNSGADAILGLYDDYYELYVLSGQIPKRAKNNS